MHVPRIVGLFLLFAVGVLFILNGCSTLLTTLPLR